MKKVILLIFLLPLLVFIASLTAIGQIIEDFESGITGRWIQSSPGHWQADTSSSISGSYSLHHCFDSPVSGTDCIGIALNELHLSEGPAHWEFSIRHGYDPSSSNNWTVFLISDSDPSELASVENISGFAAGVNLSGYDDTLRLWKIKQGDLKVIINCPVNWQTDIGINEAAKLVIERTESGFWNFSVYHQNGNPAGTATGYDNELFPSEWFAVSYKYSSARDRLLWFDDLRIEGVFYKDSTPPEIIQSRISGMNVLELTTSEELSDNSLIPGNYSLNDISETAISVHKRSSGIYRVEFGNNFNNKVLNNLKIHSICDRSGNCAENLMVYFTPVWPETGDVVISEIMADPLPAVDLPGSEYIEIKNRTKYPFNIKNWKLVSEGQGVPFMETIILPGEAVIVCSVQDIRLFSTYGKVTGLRSFPVLTDAGKIIVLTDSLGNMLHGVEYSSKWYGDELKSGGGWSLEMIDTDYPFYQEGNWEASESHHGGTPGIINSVNRHNPDNSFEGVENVFPEDSISVIVKFSEPVFSISDNPDKIYLENNRITSVIPADPLLRRFRITPEKPLQKRMIFTLNVIGDLSDFAGNAISGASFRFGITEQAEAGDVMFNELLFNPLPDDPDYVELVNCSEKIIDASQLFMISINAESGDTSGTEQACDEHRCILPDSYYAITTDRYKVLYRYPSSSPENVYNTGSLPSMPDDKGHLVLLNPVLDKVDEVIYDEKMHYSLLAGNEGVSVEKIRPGITSNDRLNWHSASESSGWGTPGAPNSVFVEVPVTDDRIILSSDKISPDNDGFEDFLIIDFNLTGIGNILKISVFDETGTFVRTIADNLFAGPGASIIWDGTSADGTMVNTGIYILLIELFDDRGKIRSWKKVCTVIRN